MPSKYELRAAQDLIRSAYNQGYVLSLEVIHPALCEPVAKTVVPVTNDMADFNQHLGMVPRQRLRVYRKRTMEYVGWISLIWGVSSRDLIHDYSDKNEMIDIVYCETRAI